MPRVIASCAVLAALSALFSVGCGMAYRNAANDALREMRAERYDQALEIYKKRVTNSKDRLLALMDTGLIEHTAGRFAESNRIFLEAERVSKEIDAVSVSEQAATLLVNETLQTYTGEDFEKLLINVYLTMNFLQLKDFDAALVECRKVNHQLEKFVREEKKPYKQNAFARYLSAVVYESKGDLNDAYVDYKKTLELMPSFPELPFDLIRMAQRLGFDDEFAEWKKRWPSALERGSDTRGKAKLVILYQAGLVPEKKSSKEERQVRRKGGGLENVVFPVPVLERRPTRLQKAELWVDGAKRAETSILNDIEETAFVHLKERIGRKIAKQIAATAVKAGIATGIGAATKNSDLAIISGIVLLAMNQADTRSWLLLPETLQIGVAYLEPTASEFEVRYSSRDGVPLRRARLDRRPELKAGETTFLVARTFD